MHECITISQMHAKISNLCMNQITFIVHTNQHIYIYIYIYIVYTRPMLKYVYIYIYIYLYLYTRPVANIQNQQKHDMNPVDPQRTSLKILTGTSGSIKPLVSGRRTKSLRKTYSQSLRNKTVLFENHHRDQWLQ